MTTPAPSRPSERLDALGVVLPPVPTPLASYLPAVRDGDLVWTAGALPVRSGTLLATGKVGDTVTPEDAADLARVCTLNALAGAAALLPGGIDDVERVVKVVGFVAGTPEFTGQPAVVNGASTLLAEVFGEAGTHARSAVGVAALPLDAPVEVELVLRVR
ncbi:RidA family protein [Pseudonocardia alni]|uniref:RidA family protein n=1 Tax=Pseudonocardia alni TaxID=33907 RepID=UPI0033DC0BF3